MTDRKSHDEQIAASEHLCTPENPCRGCRERGVGPAHESEVNAANRQEAPDPGSFGGHPYTPEERSLGYGTEHDPRFVDGVRRAQRIARDWNYRYGSLDRPPYPESFLTLEEEQTLIRAIDSLFARLDRAERRRASATVRSEREQVLEAFYDSITGILFLHDQGNLGHTSALGEVRFSTQRCEEQLAEIKVEA